MKWDYFFKKKNRNKKEKGKGRVPGVENREGFGVKTEKGLRVLLSGDQGCW